MGDFRIIIDAVGGHGQDRNKKNGEVVDFTKCSDDYTSNDTPEAIAQRCVAELVAKGVNVQKAKVVHWPADNYPDNREAGKEVVDDLMTGIRTNSF